MRLTFPLTLRLNAKTKKHRKHQTATAKHTPKPLIKARPPNAKYRTLLTIDGGGLRGIIPTMVLITLEKEIKNHIFTHKDQLIPESERKEIRTIDDFDVDLTDYFEFVAGTSIGSVIATYISNRAKGWNPTEDDMAKLQEYGDTRPGSMGLMRGIIRVFGRMVFPPWRFRLKPVTSPYMPPYSVNGLTSLLEKMYSSQTMQGLETGLLAPSFDLDRNSALCFLHGDGEQAPSYVVRTARRTHPRRSPAEGASTIAAPTTFYPGEWRADLEIEEGLDFYLKDITHASSSAPGILQPAVIGPVGAVKNLRLVDGATVANNPTLQALSYNANPPGSEDDLRHSAIFSVGCGVSFPDIPFNPRPGMNWWLQESYLLDVLMFGASEYVQQVVDDWANRNERFLPGQYSRFQIVAETDEEREYMSSMDDVKYLPQLEELGTKLANESLKDIQSFVKDYIFATKEEE